MHIFINSFFHIVFSGSCRRKRRNITYADGVSHAPAFVQSCHIDTLSGQLSRPRYPVRGADIQTRYMSGPSRFCFLGISASKAASSIFWSMLYLVLRFVASTSTTHPTPPHPTLFCCSSTCCNRVGVALGRLGVCHHTPRP